MFVADTIVAIATAPTPAAVGIVRISGPAAAEILQRLEGNAAAAADTHRLRLTRVFTPEGELIDEALCVLMRGPASYTGEDVAEIQCHGSLAILRAIVQAALAHGARMAEAGEFTRRAFLNGRLDLVQAEAIDDLIRSRTPRQAALAVQQVTGHLSAEIAGVRNDLIHLKGLLEVQIDFSEEEVSVDNAELRALGNRSAERLEALTASYDRGKQIRDGIRVAIVGKPNVGKSSLLNALLGEERAIVTEIAGTTRDVIEDSIEIAGLPVVLSDTAGLRGASQAEPIERLGIERSYAQIELSDCALVVLDGSEPLAEEDRHVLATTTAQPRVVAINKSDLPPKLSDDELAACGANPVVRISAQHATGLDDLRQWIAERVRVRPAGNENEIVVTRLRQRDALAKAAVAVRLALDSIAASQPPEMVAVDVQEALDQIGQVTGVVTPEHVLDRIFSQFCIGK